LSAQGERHAPAPNLEVLDTGVDLERAEDYFKPFVRNLEISTDRRALGLGGVGLGLTIVRTIADLLGCGTVFVAPLAPFTTAFRLSWRPER